MNALTRGRKHTSVTHLFDRSFPRTIQPAVIIIISLIQKKIMLLFYLIVILFVLFYLIVVFLCSFFNALSRIDSFHP